MTAIFKTSILLFVSLALTACGGTLLLIDKNNKESKGTYNSIDDSFQITVNGVEYKGFYVTKAGGRNSGRAIIRDTDGNTIQCEFNHSASRAIGTCFDGKGQTYQLIAD